ncbi:hypothetical protein BHE74_00033855 [Ensete ventricosum]|nr:hypothetical protein GW17_00052627 [Ensete ventricosum]RWW59226.1 hypothetical protein BHE74_00033855 [Ensete ventricosum]RZR83008.1 hypothetical protein BHM03_00009567 [Ensete ventricosum]
MGIANEAFGAPERVVEIGAGGLELRCSPPPSVTAQPATLPRQRLRIAAPKPQQRNAAADVYVSYNPIVAKAMRFSTCFDVPKHVPAM